MRKEVFFERAERFVDRSIPFMLILLTVILVLEFTHAAEKYHTHILIADYLIISFFVADLCFKWRHVRKVVPFVKAYWLDILAVFPFYLLFRFVIAAREVIAAGETVQKAMHEAVLLREARFLREFEAAKYAREARFFRFLPRFLRLFKARLYVVHGHMQLASKNFQQAHKRNHRRSST